MLLTPSLTNVRVPCDAEPPIFKSNFKTENSWAIWAVINLGSASALDSPAVLDSASVLLSPKDVCDRRICPGQGSVLIIDAPEKVLCV